MWGDSITTAFGDTQYRRYGKPFKKMSGYHSSELSEHDEQNK